MSLWCWSSSILQLGNRLVVSFKSATDSCLSSLDIVLHVSKYLKAALSKPVIQHVVLNFVKSISSDGNDIIGRGGRELL